MGQVSNLKCAGTAVLVLCTKNVVAYKSQCENVRNFLSLIFKRDIRFVHTTSPLLILEALNFHWGFESLKRNRYKKKFRIKITIFNAFKSAKKLILGKI